jgi:hypothetical protein
MKHGWPMDEGSKMTALMSALNAGQKEYEKESEGKTFYDDFKNFNTAAEGFDLYLEFFKDDYKFVEILSTEQAFECPMEPENKVEEKILSKLPPLTFTGRIDLCLKMDGSNWINDFKTTGWILDKVVSQANRSPQFIGYTYAGKKVLDFDTVGCLGNFVQIGATKSRVTGNYGKNRFNFRRVPQIYSDADLSAWKLSFIKTAENIHRARTEGIFPESFDNCFMYGKCPYLKLCQQNVPVEDLNTDGFHVEFWDVLED